jgi:hypothetical protein
MDATTLHNAIAEVCPITGVTLGDPIERNTWAFEATPEADQAQKDAGQNVIDTIPLETVPPVMSRNFIERFTDPEYLALKKLHETELAANDVSSIKVWDVVISAGTLDLNTTAAQALKADLVSDGVLTQARADEIFGAGASADVMKAVRGG